MNQITIRFVKTTHRKIIGLLSFIALLLTSCGPQKMLIQPQDTRFEQVNSIIEKNYLSMDTLNGRGQIVIESPQQSFSGRARIYIARPDSIYIKIEALLGLDVGTIFADRDSFLLYSPLENVLYSGQHQETLPLRNYLGFDLSLDQMLRFASGLSPLHPLQDSDITREDNIIHIQGHLSDYFMDYSIDPHYGVVNRVVIRDSQREILQIEEYKQFIKQGMVRVPKFIRLIRPQSKKSVTFFYDQLEINRSIPSRAFSVKVPSDAIKIRL